MSAIPRDAASVIIVRRNPANQKQQALLIRRGAVLAFAGGTWVFPGGKLEPADGSPETLTKLGLASVAATQAALLVGACRETFEEIGVVLGRRQDGGPCDAALAEILQPMRKEVSADAGAFATVFADHGLSIDAASLVFWAHWITPSLVEKRFDTRFFVASMPPGQTVHCDSAEATELLWLDLGTNPAGQDALPEEAIVHAPPTRFSLGDLALSLVEHGDAEDLLKAEAARHVVPIMPKMVRIDGQMTAVLPWDPEYQALHGDGVPPDARIPPRFKTFPSRIIPPQNISGMPK